jgi:hypothetical protein
MDDLRLTNTAGILLAHQCDKREEEEEERITVTAPSDLQLCNNYTHTNLKRSSSMSADKAWSCTAAVGARRVRALSVIDISLPVLVYHVTLCIASQSQSFQVVVRKPIQNVCK